ncbi:hypothetical protein Aduo_008875 [Ancylostoma duodenale]
MGWPQMPRVSGTPPVPATLSRQYNRPAAAQVAKGQPVTERGRAEASLTECSLHPDQPPYLQRARCQNERGSWSGGSFLDCPAWLNSAIEIYLARRHSYSMCE